MQTLTREEAIEELGAHYEFSVSMYLPDPFAFKNPPLTLQEIPLSSALNTIKNSDHIFDTELNLFARVKYGLPNPDNRNCAEYPCTDESINTAFEKLKSALAQRFVSVQEAEDKYHSSLAGTFKETVAPLFWGVPASDTVKRFQKRKNVLNRHINNLSKQQERGMPIKYSIPETDEYPDTILQKGDKLYVLTEDDNPKTQSPISIKDFTIKKVNCGSFHGHTFFRLTLSKSTKGVRYYAAADDNHVIDVIATPEGEIKHAKVEQSDNHTVFHTLQEAEEHADQRSAERRHDLSQASLNRYRAPVKVPA